MPGGSPRADRAAGREAVMCRLLLAALLGALTLSAAGAAGSAGSGQARWVITDLGTLGKKGEQSTAVAINERGQIIGNRFVAVHIEGFNWADAPHPFLWEKGTMRDLGTLAGIDRSWPPRHQSEAVAINDRGQVVGRSDTTTGPSHAFLWEKGRMRDLGTLGGTYSWPVGINDRGEVAGSSNTKTGYSRAFLWRDGRLTDLGTLGGAESEAAAINDRGQIVGWAKIKAYSHAPRQDGTQIARAFLWQNGKMTDLGLFAGQTKGAGSWAVAINDHGTVVGSGEARAPAGIGSPMSHASLWRGGKATDLNALVGKGGSLAIAVNERGDVVGVKGPDLTEEVGSKSADCDFGCHAFLWRNGKMIDLGTFAGARPGVSEPLDVNDHGDVVGWSRTLHGDHAFVWHDGVMTDLGTLPGDYRSAAVAINNRGQIVGWSEPAPNPSAPKIGRRHAVLWTLRPGS